MRQIENKEQDNGFEPDYTYNHLKYKQSTNATERQKLADWIKKQNSTI